MQTADGRLVPSSGRFASAGIASPTGSWTLSSSEFPNGAVESSLSAILVPIGEYLRPYFLSRRAAEGVLRRLGRRDRTLPPVLLQALEAAILNG